MVQKNFFLKNDNRKAFQIRFFTHTTTRHLGVHRLISVPSTSATGENFEKTVQKNLLDKVFAHATTRNLGVHRPISVPSTSATGKNLEKQEQKNLSDKVFYTCLNWTFRNPQAHFSPLNKATSATGENFEN